MKAAMRGEVHENKYPSSQKRPRIPAIVKAAAL
jgi:hypothetical protein